MEINKIEIPKENVTIREYQGWSINNTGNHLCFKKGTGHIVFVSDKEINELEIMGIYCMVKHQANIYKGLDLDITISKGQYIKDIDRIINSYDTPSLDNASSYLLICNKDLLLNYKSIISVFYNANPRYKRSSWWRFWNPRKCIVSNEAIS